MSSKWMAKCIDSPIESGNRVSRKCSVLRPVSRGNARVCAANPLKTPRVDSVPWNNSNGYHTVNVCVPETIAIMPIIETIQ